MSPTMPNNCKNRQRPSSNNSKYNLKENKIQFKRRQKFQDKIKDMHTITPNKASKGSQMCH